MKASLKKNPFFNYGIFALLLFVIVLITNLTSSLQPVDWDLQRIGFGVSTRADAMFWAKQLNASWYLDWKTIPQSVKSFPEHWQMIRLSSQGYLPSREEIIGLLINYPGQVWIIGNEPDNIWQDNLPPESYASYYHDLYFLIKRYDPTAQVAVGAVSQPTPLRMEYLDSVIREYRKQFHHQLPCDWWTLHAYILREETNSWGAGIPPELGPANSTLYEIDQHDDLSIFAANIIQFRAWMAENEFQGIPLAVTEFGILLPEEFGFSTQRVTSFLEGTFYWLFNERNTKIGYSKDSYHLVQKFAWFSLGDKNFPIADLVDFSNNTLTPAGIAFRDISIELVR